MVLITIGICVLFCLVLIGGVLWSVYENEDIEEPKIKKEGKLSVPFISDIIKQCLNEEDIEDVSSGIEYFDFRYLGYKIETHIQEHRINDTFIVEFKYEDDNSKHVSGFMSMDESKWIIKSELHEDIRDMLKQIKTYKEDFNLFLDIKNNFKDLIVNEEEDKLFLDYNYIPITIRDFTRMFDSMEEVKVYHGNRLIKSNVYSHDIYTHRMDEEYFDSYNKRVYSLGEVKPALEEIESKLLYDLSNFTDAFRSMMNVRINGFTLDMNSLVVEEDYTMKFEYLNEFNTYYFEVKPFHKQYSYNKNDLDTRNGSFSEYKSLLHIIKDILEESKAMVPFDTEERPSMVFNNTTGQLEIDKKKYLSY